MSTDRMDWLSTVTVGRPWPYVPPRECDHARGAVDMDTGLWHCYTCRAGVAAEGDHEDDGWMMYDWLSWWHDCQECGRPLQPQPGVPALYCPHCTCPHGLSMWLCEDTANHYPSDEYIVAHPW